MHYPLNDTMFVQILNPSYPFFSFDVYDFNLNFIKSGLLTKRDSLPYDTYYFVTFDKDYLSGNYKINFYGEEDQNISKTKKIGTFDFKIE